MSRQDRRELLDVLGGRLSFMLEGRTYLVPEHPVLTWIETLVEQTQDAIVPGLLADADARHLYDRLLDEDEPLDLGVCEGIGLWVLEALGGRPWWEVQRALLWSLAAWNAFDAWARAEAHVDPLALPLRSFCNLFVRFALISQEEEHREQWLTGFGATPLGNAESMENRPEWAEEEMQADFAGAMGDWAQMAGNTVPD